MTSNRERLLDAAEQLFSQHGSQAVSLREINTAAGVSQGVLHYQFGNRDGLIKALLKRRLPAITEERIKMVEALREKTQPPQLREVIEVIILPLAHLSLQQGKSGQRFLRVMARLSLERNPTFQKEVTRYFADVATESTEHLLRILAPQSRDEVHHRLMVLSYSMYAACADLMEPQWSWGGMVDPPIRTLSAEQRLELLLDFYCAGLAGNHRIIS